MAVVWEQHYPGGGVTRIVDDAYRDASPEEIQRRIHRLEETLSRITGMECEIITSKSTHIYETLRTKIDE